MIGDREPGAITYLKAGMYISSDPYPYDKNLIRGTRVRVKGDPKMDCTFGVQLQTKIACNGM